MAFDDEFIKNNLFRIKVQLQDAKTKACSQKLKDLIERDMQIIDDAWERMNKNKEEYYKLEVVAI